jgi:hypothetical protein
MRRRSFFPFLASALLVAAATASGAQTAPDASFITKYQARVTATQSEQPHWITPLVTVTPRLEQEFRSDFVRQTNSKLQDTWNLGNSKGLEIIPFSRVELLFNVPPFLDHDTGAKDGFGDVSFNSKFRFFSRNEQKGNGILTAYLAATIPTGKNGNGSCCAVVTPSIGGGKGWGNFDLTTTFGGSLPVSNAHGLGHTVTWNNVAQDRLTKTGVARFFWPEVELNSSFFHGGANDGKIATYGTPGIVIGRIPLARNADGTPGRLGLTFGAGEQIALTHFHTYNHEIVLTARVPF